MTALTVAIVTARDDKATSYLRWQQLRHAFLGRRPYTADGLEFTTESKYLQGEFGALLAVCFQAPSKLQKKLVDPPHHVDYQVAMLGAGTDQAESVLVIDRLEQTIGVGRDTIYPTVRWAGPLLSTLELTRQPELLLSATADRVERKADVSYGCSDKNTAIVMCRTDSLVMLDDCCLPSFGLVETARRVCAAGNILLLGHRKVFLPTAERPTIEVADANWTDKLQELTVEQARQTRRVFGVWAMPLHIALELNGYNTRLDGFRGGDDAELLERMDRYMNQRPALRYVVHPAARVYEIEHTNTWVDGDVQAWEDLCPKGWAWKAPGPSLATLHEAALRWTPDPPKDDDDAEDDDDEEDEEDDE